MQITPVADEIFRAYDIRGLVGSALNSDVMTLIGRAIGSEALDQGETTLVLAADARLSSPIFTKAIQEGILSTGCNVEYIGIVPTPLMYFATNVLATGSGVMITGSHNPKDYNGVKIVLKRKCLADDKIRELKQRIVSNNLYSGVGCLKKVNLKYQYITQICKSIKLKKTFKVVIDCANAVTANVAPQLFDALGCDVIPLYCIPDGHFPNHHPDPTVPENLTALIGEVKKHKADLGIAFDGDGDRVGLISSSGQIIDADKMMMSFIEDILPENPDATVVFDVKSSQHLSHLISEHRGNPVMCKSGHSFIKQKMQETGALLGGEYTSHIFFKHRWYGFDDGLYTAARYLELMDKQNSSADQLLQSLPELHTTTELLIPASDESKFKLMANLKQHLHFANAAIDTLDGLRVTFANGWGLLRVSNTTPSLALRFEADSESALAAIIDLFKSEILRLHPELHINF